MLDRPSKVAFVVDAGVADNALRAGSLGYSFKSI